MRRGAARIAISLSILLVAGAAGWGFSAFYRAGPLERPATVILERGAGLEDIARELRGAGVIDHPFVFTAGVLLSGGGSALKAGEYLFQPGSSPRAVAEKLKLGETVVRRLTIPEGLTSAQVMVLIAKGEGLSGDVTGPAPEGWLLPETYHYSFGDDRDEMVARMRRAMAALIEELWPARAPELPLATPEEALILASMVERETGLIEERARIAGVFINRLRLGMPLQSDPTVVYALTEGKGELDRPLTRSDLTLEDPFNTYLAPGLPPHAIANPGRAAIEAVLHPAQTDEIYFVATGEGGHAFARTLEEHNRNIQRLQALDAAE